MKRRDLLLPDMRPSSHCRRPANPSVPATIIVMTKLNCHDGAQKMRSSVPVRSPCRSQQTIEQDCEHDQGNDHIHVITLEGKGNCRESYTSDRRGNQQQQAKLNDGLG